MSGSASALDLKVLYKSDPMKQVLGPTKAELAEQKRLAEEAEKARLAEVARLAEKTRTEALWASHPAGNNYYAGQCVWYVANKKKTPINLGNANTWFSRAQSWGFRVGDRPQVGATATSTQGYYGHVAYVEQVYENGTLLISEMNWKGPFIVNTRVTPWSDWRYIYD